jgi:glucose-1-phosphate cytidylyltransferase
LVEIGGFPILWHIIKIYAHQGFFDFVICTGYKSDMIDEFAINVCRREPKIKIQTIFTGIDTSTGGRIKKAWGEIGDFRIMATYGDGVANVDLKALLDFHNEHGKFATVTAVRPPARFGRLHLEGNLVTKFGEKNQSEEGWINGGFFILDPEVRDYLHDYETPFEHEPLVLLAEQHHLMAYKHEAFWQPMDTLREKNDLEEIWRAGKAPWKIW